MKSLIWDLVHRLVGLACLVAGFVYTILILTVPHDTVLRDHYMLCALFFYVLGKD